MPVMLSFFICESNCNIKNSFSSYSSNELATSNWPSQVPIEELRAEQGILRLLFFLYWALYFGWEEQFPLLLRRSQCLSLPHRLLQLETPLTLTPIALLGLKNSVQLGAEVVVFGLGPLGWDPCWVGHRSQLIVHGHLRRSDHIEDAVAIRVTVRDHFVLWGSDSQSYDRWVVVSHWDGRVREPTSRSIGLHHNMWRFDRLLVVLRRGFAGWSRIRGLLLVLGREKFTSERSITPK